VALLFEFIILFCEFDIKKINNKKIRINFFKKPFYRMLLLGFFLVFVNYIYGVYIRSTATDCSLNKSTQDGGLYIAEVCRSRYSIIRLRIYESKSKKLLAERNFEASWSINISWIGKKMWFYGAEGEEYINLPPTLSDRILAQLP
ncbi:hypothetical protein QN374_16920, partial [Herbaspirillum sp. RTI4]